MSEGRAAVGRHGWAVDANNNTGTKGSCLKDKNKNIVTTWKPVGSQSTQKTFGRKSVDEYMFFSTETLTAADLVSEGGRASVTVNNKEVALICHDNIVYAVQEKCPHYGGPLHLGDIEDVPGCGPCVKCPWHAWSFSLTTGKCIAPRDRELAGNIETFPVRFDVKRNEIKIGFTEISPEIFTAIPQ